MAIQIKNLLWVEKASKNKQKVWIASLAMTEPYFELLSSLLKQYLKKREPVSRPELRKNKEIERIR